MGRRRQRASGAQQEGVGVAAHGGEAPGDGGDDGGSARLLEAAPSKAVLKFMSFTPALEAALRSQGVLDGLVLGPEHLAGYLNRFIIATNGNVGAAVRQIQEHQAWLKELQVPTMYLWSSSQVLRGQCTAEQVHEHYPMYIRGWDRYGHPVMYSQVGKISVKGVFNLVDPDTFVRYHSWMRERMMRMRDVAIRSKDMDVERYNPSDGQFTVVLDFQGSSMSQVGPTFYGMMQRTTHIDQIYYPERMFRSILIHTPFIFTAVWRMVKGFLDKDTVAKLRIVRSDYFKYLEEIIDPGQIPAEYGGSGPPLGHRDHVSQVTERFFLAEKRKEEEKDAEPESEVESVDEPDAKTARPAAPPSPTPAPLESTRTVIPGATTAATTVAESRSTGPQPTQVRKLQVALLRAHLELELVERETLDENAFLRRQIEVRKSQLKARNSASAGNLSLENVAKENFARHPQVVELELQVQRLRQELEHELEEIGAQQRAITFARSFMERPRAETKARESRERALCRLREENVALARVLNEKTVTR